MSNIATTDRKPDHPIEPLILHRWSPRAMSSEPITRDEMLTLFEAARWAPSTYNEQEWRFLYGLRDTPQWADFFNLLVEPNRVWCVRASMLCLIAAKKTLTQTGKPNPVHLFDCGNAFENLALQGHAMGLVVHGMQGFDWKAAPSALNIPDDFEPAAMFAVGRPGDPALLPEPVRAREKPSGRKPLTELICEGKFFFASS